MSSLTRKRPAPGSLHRSVSPPPAKKTARVSSGSETHLESAEVPERPGQLKIVSWNVNGTRPFLQKQISFASVSASPLRSVLRRHGWPSVLCLQEVKIASKDLASQRQLQHAANDKANPDEVTYEAVYSLPRDKYNATGFGGKVHGVASLIRKDVLLHIISTRLPSWDLEGRILIHEFDTCLVLINGYWVNGTDHPHRDQEGRIDGTRHDLKLRYHQYILDEVLRYEKAGKVVVLVGDMNVAKERVDGYPNLRVSPVQHVHNRADFNSKFFLDEAGIRAVDLFRHFHGQKKKYTWHSTNAPHGRVCDRVDYILASRELVERYNGIADTDICDNAADKCHSDHVPLWVMIDMQKLPKSGHAIPEESES